MEEIDLRVTPSAPKKQRVTINNFVTPQENTKRASPQKTDFAGGKRGKLPASREVPHVYLLRKTPGLRYYHIRTQCHGDDR
jgi:hypothetical protein